ncbi:MAG TPA: phospholipase C, phosphocholine-specific [Caulobacteraceae bacterium]|jgi:phospholipase C
MRRSRRGFLQLAGGAAAGAALPPAIAQALALPARRGTGTLRDLQHVVVFMQENRSFDHYFGTLRGVRGFADPRPLQLPSGANVFHQPKTAGSSEAVTPFHMDAATTRAQTIFSLDHSWKGSHEKWKWHDAWIPAKTPLTMGYFTRADLPFYYALADTFTICDAYHCSIFGPTNPNRLFLFTGTSGLAAGNAGTQVVTNQNEQNNTADPANDGKDFQPYTWPTYAERLQQAGVSWRVYQEHDNYGDNPLAFFANFRGPDGASALHQLGRAWVDGSNAENAKASNGEHLVAAFARDVAADALPKVSWIVAPYKLCEHPSASPAAGEDFTARLIAALASNPEVWAKTALILNYDENDGFFDHMPPLVPPIAGAPGKSTAALDGEVYNGVPVGLGPRVPMIVVSPWTKGGWVNSQLFDHTSVIRLLEARFGVHEPHITPWRRTVAGDLTSVFDFAAVEREAPVSSLPDTSGLPAAAVARVGFPWPKPPATAEAPPRQEPGARPARALPYAFDAWAGRGQKGLDLTIANTGDAGAGFALYPAKAETGGPWFYAVDAGGTVQDQLPADAAGYDFTLHGPNGFLRQFRGGAAEPLEVDLQRAGEALSLILRNRTPGPVIVRAANAYARGDRPAITLSPRGETTVPWPIADAGHWYDIAVTVDEDPTFMRRLAGHLETGRPSHSDPALEWTS